MTAKKKLNITVKIDDNYLDRIGDVADRLKSKGFDLSASLEAIGILTGSVADDALDKIATVEGVSAIEEERTDYHTQ
jgi:hypothetical protein